MSRPFYQPGRYIAEVIAQGLGEAKTGTPQIVIRFRVLETETGEQLQQQYERTIYRAITEKTMPYILADLRTLGYTRDSFRFIDPQEPNFHSFAGKQFTAFCEHRDDLEGNPREQWGIASDNQFEVKPIESKKLRQLDQMFGKQLKDLTINAPKQTAAPVTAGSAPGDDDVPF